MPVRAVTACALALIAPEQREEIILPGEVPNPLHPPTGCVFHPRCPLANERCKQERPMLLQAFNANQVACHAVQEGRG